MLTKIRNTLARIKSTVQDHRQNKYVSYSTTLRNWYEFRNLKYEMYDLESVTGFKTSDTIFILGSGPSLNLIKQEHIKIISHHDSFGINFSFLKEEVIPTFHQMSYERNLWARNTIVERLSSRRKLYNNTIFFLSDKAYRRLGHPRITPYFFSEEPKCCCYKLPKPIFLDRPRPFGEEDFDKTVYYRGTITLVLDLVMKLKYKNIILLGVDPNTPAHFFDNMVEMNDYCVRLNKQNKELGLKKFENMVPKGNKFNTIDVYFYSLNDYLSRRRNVNLFVGFKNNMLYPKIPAYFD